ncbi:DNA adenine methylase [Spirulina subsalsa]|uniref:DNA adenine methylase n=1 Tax=Spirulina subsalsa TaxID=54311 RepID=UPI000313533E|nr:DNA adenine methylase [Spirulina subsalsa]
MTIGMHSPFRYPGGKFYARKLILEHIPEHENYVEPFAGGASIFFAKDKVKYNWLNDIDEELINCFLMIRDYPEELIEKLQGEKATKERHYFYKHDYSAQNDLERATRWYYLNRTSYSGIMKAESCYWGYGEKYSMRPENWGRNILRTSEKLQGVKLTHLDFEKVFENLPKNTFLFVDPPYFSARQDNFYTHFFCQEDHIRLCQTLKKYSDQVRFLLTYDNVPEIRGLYQWTDNIYDREWNYTIGRTDDQKKITRAKSRLENNKGSRYKGKEVFITNYSHKITEKNVEFVQLCLPL